MKAIAYFGLAGLLLGFACSQGQVGGDPVEQTTGESEQIDGVGNDPDPQPNPNRLPPPDPKEYCHNNQDDDGDGLTDEDCPCKLNTTELCYTGPAGTRNIGSCTDGIKSCVGTFDDAEWTSCSGDVHPSEEICDGEDNNCNGLVDEGCGGDEPADPPPVEEEPADE